MASSVLFVLLQRHRAVMEAVKQEMEGGVHALSIQVRL